MVRSGIYNRLLEKLATDEIPKGDFSVFLTNEEMMAVVEEIYPIDGNLTAIEPAAKGFKLKYTRDGK